MRNFLLEHRLQGWIGLAVMLIVYCILQSQMPFHSTFRSYGLATPWLMAGIAGATTTLGILYGTIANFYMSQPIAARPFVVRAAAIVKGISYALSVVIAVGMAYLVFASVTAKVLHYIYIAQVVALLLMAVFVLIIDHYVFHKRDGVGSNSTILDEKRRDILVFDWAVLIAVFLTIVIILTIQYVIPTEYINQSGLVDDFLVSFKSGAVCFEIMIACIVFDPRPFLLEYESIAGGRISSNKTSFKEAVQSALTSIGAFFKTWRIWLLFSVLIVIAACSAYYLWRNIPARGTVRIAIATWPGFAIGNVGRDQGFFSGLDVDIRIIDDPTARLAAFRGGQFDVNISSLDVFAQETVGDGSGRIFMVTDRSRGADGLVTRPDVKDIRELLGHSIAVARGSPSQFLLHKLFQQHRLDLAQVHLVFFQDPTLAGQAFVSGKVDASVTWEPLMSQIVQEGKGKILMSSADVPDAIVDVLVGSDHFLSDKETVKKFVQGWLRAVQFTKSNQQQAYPIIAKALGMTLTPGQDVMAGIALADLPDNKRILCSAAGGQSLAEVTLRDAQQYWVEAGIIPAAGPPPAQLIVSLICGQ